MTTRHIISNTDIANLINGIDLAQEDMISYLAENVDSLKKKLKINALIKELANWDYCNCSEEDDDTTPCNNCNIYTYFGITKQDVIEILTKFTENLTYRQTIKYDNNDGCKYLEEYSYTFDLNENLTISYYFKNLFTKDKINIITNKLTDITYDLNQNDKKWDDETYQQSIFLNDDPILLIENEALYKDINVKLYNTTTTWKYIVEKHNMPSEKIIILMHELVHLILSWVIEQPYYISDI